MTHIFPFRFLADLWQKSLKAQEVEQEAQEAQEAHAQEAQEEEEEERVREIEKEEAFDHLLYEQQVLDNQVHEHQMYEQQGCKEMKAPPGLMHEEEKVEELLPVKKLQEVPVSELLPVTGQLQAPEQVRYIDGDALVGLEEYMEDNVAYWRDQEVSVWKKIFSSFSTIFWN